MGCANPIKLNKINTIFKNYDYICTKNYTMKNLKLAFVLAITILSTTMIKAQTTTLIQAKFGVASFNDDPKTDGLSGGFAFGFGAGIEKALSDNFYFQPTVNFNSKAISVDYTYEVPVLGVSSTTKNDWTTSSLEVPLYFLYKTGQPGDMRFIFGFGPSLGFRIGGNNSGSVTQDGVTQYTWDRKMSYGSDSTDDLKSFVFGFGVQAGLEFSGKFQAGIEWNTDLNNQSNVSGYKATTGLFALRLAMLLGGRNY